MQMSLWYHNLVETGIASHRLATLGSYMVITIRSLRSEYSMSICRSHYSTSNFFVGPQYGSIRVIGLGGGNGTGNGNGHVM